jgi:hypothetical protein
MALEGIRCEDVNWIEVSQDRCLVMVFSGDGFRLSCTITIGNLITI